MLLRTETLVERIIDAANNASATAPVCDNEHHCRAVPSIIFSCASTVFLCTWVALHPDVPADPYAPWWKMPISPVIENRVVLMLLAFISPEYIFGCAYVDWTESCCKVRDIIKQHPECEWTETHAQLLRMNGFQIVKQDGTSYRLGWKSSFPESHVHHILHIPVEEIEDRSKADFAAKIVTMVQTIWFVLQIVNRAIQGLTVTELELTTLAHAALNIIIYWLWWNKPTNVGIPFKLYPINDESRRRNDEEKSGEQMDKAKGRRVDPESRIHRPRLPVRARVGAYIGSPNLTPGCFTIALGLMISGSFGAIHCLAWNAHFPTDIESNLWRVSAPVVTVAPFVAYILAMTLDLPIRTSKPTTMLLYAALTPYVLARLSLLAVALSTLRDLPYKAYLIPSWTSYIPHI